MIKVIGVILIVVCSGYIGFYKSNKLKNRVNKLSIISFMLEEILIMIRYKAMTVYDIFSSLKENKMFSELDFINNLNIDYKKSFYAEFSKAVELSDSSLSNEEKDLLKQFGNCLGTSDIEGQISTIKMYQKSFDLLHTRLSCECEKKSKLYQSLGILVGAFISIIIL